MRLSLTFPNSWNLKEAPDKQLVAILPGDKIPEAILTFGPITLLPDEQRVWIEQTMRSDVPRGTQIKLGRIIDHETSVGWPVRLVEAEVLTAKEELVECRLCAFFVFMEHAAVAIARTADRARMEAHGKAFMRILETGRPDWSGEPICLTEAWDLEPKQPRAAKASPPIHGDGALTEVLAQSDEQLAKQPTALAHVRRGGILLDLRRPASALESLQAALVLDPNSVAAHYFAGVALGDLGQHAQAIVEWEAALKLDPKLIDAQYNLAQARFQLKDYAAALAGFQAVLAMAPSDVMPLRKVIQCLYALERYDEGQAARTTFRERWAASKDPAARLTSEYVFDQFAGDGFVIHALETLRPRDPTIYALFTFRAVDEHDQPFPAALYIETSDQARQAGTPFVMTGVTGQQSKVLGTAQHLPVYPELKKRVLHLLTEAMQGLKPAHGHPHSH